MYARNRGTATASPQPSRPLPAPRRTGKSTFLQADLVPELEKRGVVVVYVDLWSDQKRDPGSLIAEVVGRALIKHLGPVAKAAKAGAVPPLSGNLFRSRTFRVQGRQPLALRAKSEQRHGHL